MTAASVWSLILPAIEQTAGGGCRRFCLRGGGASCWVRLLLALLDEFTRQRGGERSRTAIFCSPVRHHAHQYPRGHGRRPRVRAGGGRGGACGRGGAGARHRRAELSRGRQWAPLFQSAVKAARLCNQRCSPARWSRCSACWSAGGGACACADAVAFELCGGRCSTLWRKSCRARKLTGTWRRGLSFYDGLDVALDKIFLPPVAPERLTNGFTAIKL